jgi:GNAT superfamily N-acetyltransferase
MNQWPKPEEGKGKEGYSLFTLRQATAEDLPLLFRISTEAMRPVSEKLHPDKPVDLERKFEEYKAKFEPQKIQVIRYEGNDVGRLRVVRSAESIYVGGIQILPSFQGKGIGHALFSDLIEESKKSGILIILEVHDVNEDAMKFYKNLGFEEGEKVGNQTVMRFVPKN